MSVLNQNVVGGHAAKNGALLKVPRVQRSTIINLVRRSNARILFGGCCIFNLRSLEPTLIFGSFQEFTSDLATLTPNCQVYACPNNTTYTVDLLYYPPTANAILTGFANLVFDGNGVGTFQIQNPNYASRNAMQLYQIRINGYGGNVCDGNCYSETFILLN